MSSFVWPPLHSAPLGSCSLYTAEISVQPAGIWPQKLASAAGAAPIVFLEIFWPANRPCPVTSLRFTSAGFSVSCVDGEAERTRTWDFNFVLQTRWANFQGSDLMKHILDAFSRSAVETEDGGLLLDGVFDEFFLVRGGGKGATALTSGSRERISTHDVGKGANLPKCWTVPLTRAAFNA